MKNPSPRVLISYPPKRVMADRMMDWWMECASHIEGSEMSQVAVESMMSVKTIAPGSGSRSSMFETQRCVLKNANDGKENAKFREDKLARSLMKVVLCGR